MLLARGHAVAVLAFVSVVSALGAFLVCGAAFAQPSEQPSAGLQPRDRATAAAPSKETPEQIKERGRIWFRQCMDDWDAATHMTKTEWERTCRRVAVERTKFLIEQPK